MLEEDWSETLLKMISFNKKLLSEQLFLEHSQHTVPSSAPKQEVLPLSSVLPSPNPKKQKILTPKKIPYITGNGTFKLKY